MIVHKTEGQKFSGGGFEIPAKIVDIPHGTGLSYQEMSGIPWGIGVHGTFFVPPWHKGKESGGIDFIVQLGQYSDHGLRTKEIISGKPGAVYPSRGLV